MRISSSFLVCLVSLSGMLLILDAFVRDPLVQLTAKTLTTWVVIMTGVTVGVGLVSASNTHVSRVRRRSSGWYNSVVLLITMFIVFLVGITLGTNYVVYRFIFDNVLVTSSAVVYGLLGFFVLSATYRAFSVRNREAIAMFLTTIITTLGTLIIGQYLGIGPLSSWFFDVLSLGPNRGLLLTVFVGGFAFMLRLLIGRERRWIGTEIVAEDQT